MPMPETLAKGITVSAHKPTNSVFIRHYEADLARIKRLVKEQLDVPLPQVQIAAQMVVIVRNALEQLGVQWGGGVVGRNGGNTLLGRGLAQPVNPVTGLATPQASGTPTTFNPTANPGFTGGTILPVDPATGLATGGNVVSLPTSGLPTAANPAMGLLFGIVGNHFNLSMAIQALETQGKARSLAEPKTVTVEEGERLVIGGVLTDNDTKTQREVPLLGRIPVLGWLFKSRELTVDSQEMVVIITPTVIPIQRAR